MLGRFAGIINLVSAIYATAILFLSINYFIGTIGTQWEYFSEIECITKEQQNGTEALTPEQQLKGPYLRMPKYCKYLNIELAAGSIALITGVVQLIICILALATRFISWVVWVIGHAAAFLFSLVAMSLVFGVYVSYHSAAKDACRAGAPMQGLGIGIGIGYHQPDSQGGGGGYSPTPACDSDDLPVHTSFVIGDYDTLKSVVLLFGIMLFLNVLFSLVGSVLMLKMRKSTAEGGPGKLENKAEELVKRISSSAMKQFSKGQAEPDTAAAPAEADAAAAPPPT
jgi:hypothetical protein